MGKQQDGELSFMMHVVRQGLFLFNFFTFFIGFLVIAMGGILIYTLRDVAAISQGVVEVLGAVVIVLGVLLIIMGFLGCCGSISQSVKLLNAFFYYILVLLLIEIIVGVLAYFYEAELALQLNGAFVEFGKDLDPYKIGILSSIQKDYSCCGGAGYSDWIDIFDKSDVSIGVPYGETFDLDEPKNSDTPFPPTCCQQSASSNIVCNSDISLLYTNGCVSNFLDAITDNLLTIGIVCSVIGGLQIIAIFSSWILMRAMKRAYGIN